MRGEYDVFERFPDGSTLRRTTVVGRFEALRTVQELREHSDNDFFVFRSYRLRPALNSEMAKTDAASPLAAKPGFSTATTKSLPAYVRDKARGFAERQKKSPFVKMARVTQVG